MEGIKLLSTGVAIKFERGTGEGSLPAVLIVGGWGSPVFRSSTYLEAARRIREVGYHTLLLSMQGHQCTEGDIEQMCRSDHLRDIYVAINWLKQQPEVDSSRICAWGTSYGAYLLAAALRTAPNPSFALLALRAPALYPDDGWHEPSVQAMADMEQLLAWRFKVKSEDDSAALRGISRHTGHLLVISSEHDEDMPPSVTESYRLAAKPAASRFFVTIEGASHTLQGEQREKFLDILPRWFRCRYPSPSV